MENAVEERMKAVEQSNERDFNCFGAALYVTGVIDGLKTVNTGPLYPEEEFDLAGYLGPKRVDEPVPGGYFGIFTDPSSDYIAHLGIIVDVGRKDRNERFADTLVWEKCGIFQKAGYSTLGRSMEKYRLYRDVRFYRADM